MEFGGWLFQDAGDLTCALHWTDRALDYALDLGDPRVARTALPILEQSRAEWLDHSQVRDYALCVARLATAYADAGDLEQACAAATEAMALAQGLGSRRVAGQIELVHRRLGRWRQEPAVASLRGSLEVLVDSFWPERAAS